MNELFVKGSPDRSLAVLARAEALVVEGDLAGCVAAHALACGGRQTVLAVSGCSLPRDLVDYRRPWLAAGDLACLPVPFADRFRACCGQRLDSGEQLFNLAQLAIQMEDLLLDAGVRLFYGMHACAATFADADRLAGAVVVAGRGLGVVLAKVVVDATGDADLAAWAGASFEYGNDRDAWSLWGSFGNFNAEKRTSSRHYESAMEVRDPHDWVRMVVGSRRRPGIWRDLPPEMPQVYPTPRESRRIVGRAKVTYGGILAGETFPDVMVVCQSNFDIKGIATSDLLCSGVVWSWRLGTQYVAALPYRATLPVGIENCLVAGRAFSVCHDALALARMQRDMVALGVACGVAAARSVRTGTPPAQLEIGPLQREWVRQGALRASDLRHWGRAFPPLEADEARRQAQALLANGGRAQRRLARLARSTVGIPCLTEAFAAATCAATKVKLARLLAYLGASVGVPYLLARIARDIAGDLPPPFRRTHWIPPEHGWAPEPVYSLYAISLAGEGRRCADLLATIAERIVDEDEAYGDKWRSPFEYVRVICTVAERHPGPKMLPALERLLAKRSLRGLAVRYDDDPRRAYDPVRERRAYLEVCLGRGLARCGDTRGDAILAAYVDDCRGTLAESARAARVFPALVLTSGESA